MQNTSEQQNERVQDTGTTIHLQPAQNKRNFLVFLLAGFIVMTAIVFAGLYIKDVTAVILNKPKEAEVAPVRIPLTQAMIDSMAATIPNDKALEVRDNLVLWLKADALASAKSNDSVQVLPNAAGSLHALQSAPASQPLFIEKALNGKPVLRFDGVDDFYFLGNMAADSTPASIYIVWQKPTAGGNQYQRVFSSSNTGIDYLSKGAAFIPSTENTGVGSSPARIDMVIDPMLDLRNFYIGRLNASPEQFYFGDLAEMLVYTRVLSPDEQKSVEAYLKNKYGL